MYHLQTGVYRHHFTVPESAVDQNGHVNNVVYVQWMQDVAILHYEAAGGTQAMEEAGATWVARSHHIEYLKPVYAGEDVIALTWVENLRRVRSLTPLPVLGARATMCCWRGGKRTGSLWILPLGGPEGDS